MNIDLLNDRENKMYSFYYPISTEYYFSLGAKYQWNGFLGNFREKPDGK
ncbi:MAG: hypothetical protein FWF70_00650 [Bacteroidetes bacterium]|nr:hypothetical protein [Bacteroidota bacterium]